MRLTIVAFSLLVCGSLLRSPVDADLIQLRDSEEVLGRVLEYVNQELRIELPDGKVIIRKLSDVERIEFGEQPTERELAIEAELEEAIKNVRPSPKASVVMYIDTEDPEAEIAKNEVEYKCYSEGGGYSGGKKVSLRCASVKQERPGVRRIELDPGPPYRVFIRHVTLNPSEVVNLGRIVLEKLEYEGTASIQGIVKDTFGNPIPGAKITAGQREVVSDEKGGYRLDGFELEKVLIQAQAKGFRGGTAKVSIRDMRNRKINQDLTMFRPRRVKLRYVISNKGDNSFEGPEVEEGAIELVVDSVRTDLSDYHYDSESFREFAADTGLKLQIEQGKIKLGSVRCTMLYQESAAGLDFDSVKSMGQIDMNQQFCPLLDEGGFVLMQALKPTFTEGARYCVKILVEEISLAPVDVEDK